MEPKHYDYIDALRGYAILLVIAAHSGAYFSVIPFQTLHQQTARGVQLFFVASAITLCMSWTARDDGVLPFYIRRFFRIAPMFYLAILFYGYTSGLGPNLYAPDGMGLRHVLMTLTFTHGLMPDTITSLVPGSWSIADEMMFYAMFPVLVAVLKRVNFRGAAILTGLAVWIYMVIQRRADIYVSYVSDPAWHAAWGTFVFLWIVQQLPCFLFGMLAFKWIADGHGVRWPRTLVVTSVAAMLILAFFPGLRYIGRLGLPVQYGFVFALFALGLARWQPRILVNPIIGWIGKVSYSCYLVHFAVITFVPVPHATFAEAYLTVVVTTVALSTITYLYIEKPFNRLGHRLARRFGPTSAVEPRPLSVSAA